MRQLLVTGTLVQTTIQFQLDVEDDESMQHVAKLVEDRLREEVPRQARFTLAGISWKIDP